MHVSEAFSTTAQQNGAPGLGEGTPKVRPLFLRFIVLTLSCMQKLGLYLLGFDQVMGILLLYSNLCRVNYLVAQAPKKKELMAFYAMISLVRPQLEFKNW